MRRRVGVDVGGTFPDLVAIEDGTIAVRKVPSTPAAPDEGMRAALAEAAIDPANPGMIAHGTTVATNAVLERAWADTAVRSRTILSLRPPRISERRRMQ